MTAPVVIHDPDDSRLDDYRELRDPARRLAIELGRRMLVVEGVVAIRTLLGSRRTVRSLLLHPREHARLAEQLDGLEAPVYLAQRDVLETVAGFDVHRGALAAADRFEPEPLERLLRNARRVVVLQAATNVENVGTVFRNAAAFGFDGVLLDPGCGDPLVRRSVRVSSGHVLTVPFARCPHLPEVVPALRAAGFALLALTPAAGAQPLTSVRAGAAERVALLLGTEGAGLTAATMAAADRRVRIRLAPGVDSLNLATAAGIAMHHLARLP